MSKEKHLQVQIKSTFIYRNGFTYAPTPLTANVIRFFLGRGCDCVRVYLENYLV